MSEEFLIRCIEYFGKEKQQVVAIEEMAELTQQLSKFVINHPNARREKVVEEYIDVLVMLNQIRIIFEIKDDEVEAGRTFKLERLKHYMESMETP